MSCEDLCSADSQLEHLLRKQLQFLSWEIKSIIDKIVTKVCHSNFAAQIGWQSLDKVPLDRYSYIFAVLQIMNNFIYWLQFYHINPPVCWGTAPLNGRRSELEESLWEPEHDDGEQEVRPDMDRSHLHTILSCRADPGKGEELWWAKTLLQSSDRSTGKQARGRKISRRMGRMSTVSLKKNKT